jgi:hypothetical protein
MIPAARRSRTCLALATAAAAAAALAACVPAHAAPPHGRLLAAERLAGLSPLATRKAIGLSGFPTDKVRVGVDAFRLTYATTTATGARTKATGLLVLPHGAAARRGRVRTVAYEHGTLVRRSDAPSSGLDSFASGAALLFAGSGFATVAPDYLGLGHGHGAPTYMHTPTEVSASLDLLSAARAFAAHRHVTLDRRLLLTGFSQGGQAAMALGRALQDGALPAFGVRALAPVSGPFDLLGTEVPAVLDGTLDPRVSNYQLTYLLRAWQPIYHLYGQPAEVWQAAQVKPVATLFDGRHGDQAVLAGLPATPAELFTPTMLARLRHPDGALLEALKANSAACAWRPRVPVRLYAASKDTFVDVDNSHRCLEQLRARETTTTTLVDLGPLDHFPSLFAATPQVLDWFQTLSAGDR